MELPGGLPSTEDQRLKALFFGHPKVGKTTAAIQFPRPYLIDVEGGATKKKYKDILEKGEGRSYRTTDFGDILKVIDILNKGGHPYKTLIIDSLTVVYNNLILEGASLKGDKFAADIKYAKQKMKSLVDKLINLDMNVIVIAHAKKEYGDEMKVLGETFDIWEGVAHLMDLVINIQEQGKKRMAIVKGSREYGIENGDRFEWSYEELAERYGREILEKDAAPQALATHKQLEEINKLFEVLEVSEQYIKKILDKYKSDTLEEMPKEKIQAWIDQLKKRIEV